MRFLTFLYTNTNTRVIAPTDTVLANEPLATITVKGHDLFITAHKEAIIHVGATGQRGERARAHTIGREQTVSFRVEPITELMVSHRGTKNRPKLPSIEVDCIE